MLHTTLQKLEVQVLAYLEENVTCIDFWTHTQF